MMRVLITGGAGFIGSEFVNLYADKYDIHVIDKLTYAGDLNNIINGNFKSSQFYNADISDFTACDKVFKKIHPDIVINFAAETHVDNSIESASEFVTTNLVGTHVLLELSKKYKVLKYIQISTDEVYGHLEPNDPPFTENTPLNPRSPYSATKAGADLLAMSYFNTHGVPVCITRCSNNYGRNQHIEKLIPKIIVNALKNQPIPIYGNGLNIRDWIYVEDHIRGINDVMIKGIPGNTYNFGGNIQIDNLTLCKKILTLMDKPHDLIQFVDDRKGHDFRYHVDYTNTTERLEWVPTANFDEMLKYTLNQILSKNGWAGI